MRVIQKIKLCIPMFGLFATVMHVRAQDHKQPVPKADPQYKIDPKYDVKRCAPKLLKRQTSGENPSIHFHKGEKSSGYSPIVSFEILESGELANVRITRSSGFAEEDAYALKWARTWRYNKRKGCGVIESDVDITIDWGAGP